MTEKDAISDAEVTDMKPRKSRQPKAERRVIVYGIKDGTRKEFGSYPEAVIGEPLERRLPTFLRDIGPGDYVVDIRKPNGHFERSLEFSIATTEPERERIIDVEPEEFDDDDHQEFSFVADNSRNTVEVENLLLKERLKRLEDDLSRQKSGNQSEMQTLISALEESRREQRELMMLMITQAQKPQQDATTQAMNILEKSLGIVTKAKAISEEIAPQESASNGSFMGDAARLVDSVGKHAGTFAPIVMGALGASRSAPAPAPNMPNNIAPSVGSNSGELANLAEQIQKRKSESSENEELAAK